MLRNSSAAIPYCGDACNALWYVRKVEPRLPQTGWADLVSDMQASGVGLDWPKQMSNTNNNKRSLARMRSRAHEAWAYSDAHCVHVCGGPPVRLSNGERRAVRLHRSRLRRAGPGLDALQMAHSLAQRAPSQDARTCCMIDNAE